MATPRVAAKAPALQASSAPTSVWSEHQAGGQEMMRNSMAVLAALATMAGASFAVTACENASDRERKAEQQQIQADQNKLESQRNADQKAREEQQKAADMRAEADKKFAQEKSDYFDKVHQDLADLDKKVNDMKDVTNRATGATKDAFNKTLKDVQAKRDLISSDLDEIGRSTAINWDGIKAKVDKDLDEFKSTVRTASTRIKAPSSSREPYDKSNPSPTPMVPPAQP
jgi:hypothetical protein